MIYFCTIYREAKLQYRPALVFENCPCADGSGPAAPPFAGSNWYCGSGGTDIRNSSAYYFNDPLWDGSGCITSTCCNNPIQPWFYAELSGITTSAIEVSICGIDGFRISLDQETLW